MIVVTGAAGFIGSNLVKALNERGEDDIIAVDNLTRRRQVPQPGRLPHRRLPRQGRVSAQAVGLGAYDGEVTTRPASGCLLRHDGGRRALHDGEQLPLLGRAARLLPGRGGAFHLRVLGGGVRRRSSVPRGSPARAAAECLWLFEVPVRQSGAPALERQHRAGGGAALFQRIRPARSAQEPHGVGRVPLLQPVPGGRPGQAVRRQRRLRGR